MPKTTHGLYHDPECVPCLTKNMKKWNHGCYDTACTEEGWCMYQRYADGPLFIGSAWNTAVNGNQFDHEDTADADALAWVRAQAAAGSALHQFSINLHDFYASPK